MVFAVWSWVMYIIMCFVKWSWNTRMFATLGGLFSSMVASILVKSMCKTSFGAVDTIGCRDTLDKLTSYCKQCVLDLMDFCTWLVIPGHQKYSCSKDSVQSCPWWPTSQWHPFRAVTQCALGTTKSRKSSVSPLGIEHRYKAPWWIVKFGKFCKISLPSLLEVCSARSVLRFVCFCAFSQSNTMANIGFSVWASAKLVTCISTNGWPPVTHTSCSKHWSPSTMARSWILAWCAILKVTPFTVSESSWVVTQLSTSSTILSCPFWYYNLKLNHTRAPTYWWPMTSRLGIDIMYVSGLLSVHTTNDWQGRYSLKCSVTVHFNARNSCLVEW